MGVDGWTSAHPRQEPLGESFPSCIGPHRLPAWRLSPTCVGCVAVPQVFALPSIFFWMLGCATAESSPPQNRTWDGASDCTVVIAYPLPHGRILETLILGFAGDERSFLSPPEAPILCPSRKSVNSVSRGRVEKRRKSLLSFIIWAGLRLRSAPPLSSTHWGQRFGVPPGAAF